MIYTSKNLCVFIVIKKLLNNSTDTHESMKEKGYKLLEWVLNHSNPDIVSLEYVGIKNEDDETIICSLKKQLNQLQTICTQTR
ncbi:hypothetical protein [uncultured Clostridium sp.]|uniref:hypothetical protein n=1 Tax=uncultured Clostridium sp. TaxID=59620 RepID=UPI0028E9CF37|nr:hypothetical protein [uncultured Clostridium sp.]